MQFRRISRRCLIMLTVLMFVISPAGAQNDRAAELPKVEFEHFTLPNGMQVVLHVDRKLPMVHVNSWFHVGSKNERLGRSGFAHLFEHMMFEGSKNANGKYFSFIEKIGANLFAGGVNGTTDVDRTNYFETVPSANLEYVLWIESDRLATLTDVLTKQKLDNERDIVKNERRQGLENRPYGRAFTLIFTNVFPFGHPYSHDVIGSHEDLTAASVEDVQDFFKTYYTPNNLSLAITGDFQVAEARRLVEKYFGPISPGPALDRPRRWIPALEGERIVEANDRVPQERTYFAWATPAYFEQGDAELELAALILADGLSSRLRNSLVYQKQLCSSVEAFQSGMEIAGLFAVIATARRGVSLKDVEQNVSEEIARLAKEGPTADELKRAKNKWEFQYVTGLERIGGFGGKADLLNQYNTLRGSPDQFSADVERHRSPTADDVRAAVSKWLNTPNRLLVRFHPEALSRPTGVTLDRSKPPALGTDPVWHAPEVKTAKLDNGVEVFVVERKDLPKVAVSLATRAGSVFDPPGKDGLASLAVQVMRRATRTRKAIEIDTTLGDLGTALNGSANREFATLGFEVLRRNLAQAVDVLADVAREPAFPQDEIDRERKQRLDELSQVENNADAISRRVSMMLAFGRNHPYGRPPQGLTGTISTISAEDLSRFHAAHWKPASSLLVFVGDISLPEAVDLGRRRFGSWSGGSAPVVTIPPPEPAGPGKMFLIDRPDAAQTVISEILPGPPRSSSDYYAFTLANAVWGGAAGARLGSNLREEKAYSYGVFSFPTANSRYGAWIASGGVQSNRTAESVVEFEKELKFIAGEKPVSENELADAKGNRVRGYAQQFESLGRIANQVVQLWAVGLPVGELQREPDELQKTTRTSVNAAAEKYASPSRSTLLLVGDLSKVEEPVRTLKLRDIVIIDSEGKPITKR